MEEGEEQEQGQEQGGDLAWTGVGRLWGRGCRLVADAERVDLSGCVSGWCAGLEVCDFPVCFLPVSDTAVSSQQLPSLAKVSSLPPSLPAPALKCTPCPCPCATAAVLLTFRLSIAHVPPFPQSIWGEPRPKMLRPRQRQRRWGNRPDANSQVSYAQQHAILPGK